MLNAILGVYITSYPYKNIALTSLLLNMGIIGAPAVVPAVVGKYRFSTNPVTAKAANDFANALTNLSRGGDCRFESLALQRSSLFLANKTSSGVERQHGRHITKRSLALNPFKQVRTRKNIERPDLHQTGLVQRGALANASMGIYCQ